MEGPCSNNLPWWRPQLPEFSSQTNPNTKFGTSKDLFENCLGVYMRIEYFSDIAMLSYWAVLHIQEMCIGGC